MASIPRHVNPHEAVEENLQAEILSIFYERALRLIGSREFLNATSVLETAEGMYKPGRIRYFLERFNSLPIEEVKDLNLTERDVNLAIELANRGELEDSLKVIMKGLKDITKANLTRTELLKAYKELGEGLS